MYARNNSSERLSFNRTLIEERNPGQVSNLNHISSNSLKETDSFRFYRETEDNLIVDAAKDTVPSQTDDLIGAVVGGTYKIISLLGSGGMSKVYKARHLVLENYVALKFLLPQVAHDDKVWMRFQQEARAASKLKHRFIASVIEFGFDGDRPFIVMDYVEGVPLSEILNRSSKLPMGKALSITIKICEALEYAHDRGIIHRDIKPSNVIVNGYHGNNLSLKIVDFGIAKELRRSTESENVLTQTGEIFGTPSYMSPEQCLGAKVDTRTDIYSLGCLLYELLSGKTPFDGESQIAVIMKHINDPVPTISDELISDSLKKVVARTLEKRPENRYQNIRLLAADLGSINQGNAPFHVAQVRMNKSLPAFKRTQLASRILISLGILVVVSSFSGLMVDDHFAFSFLLFLGGWWLVIAAWCDQHRFQTADQHIATQEPTRMMASLNFSPGLRSLWKVKLTDDDGNSYKASIMALPMFDKNLPSLIFHPEKVFVNLDSKFGIPLAFKFNGETYILHDATSLLPDTRWLGDLDVPLRRCIAAVIDGLILSVFPFLLFLFIDLVTAFDVFPYMVANTIAPALSLLTSIESVFMPDQLILALIAFVSAAYSWFYFSHFESSKSRATIGKLLMKLKVQTVDGSRLKFRSASMRYLSKVASSFAVIALSHYVMNEIQYKPPSVAGGLVVLGMGYLLLILFVWVLRKSILHDLFSGKIVVESSRN